MECENVSFLLTLYDVYFTYSNGVRLKSYVVFHSSLSIVKYKTQCLCSLTFGLSTRLRYNMNKTVSIVYFSKLSRKFSENDI